MERPLKRKSGKRNVIISLTALFCAENLIVENDCINVINDGKYV